MGTVLNGNLDVLQTIVTALAKHNAPGMRRRIFRHITDNHFFPGITRLKIVNDRMGNFSRYDSHGQRFRAGGRGEQAGQVNLRYGRRGRPTSGLVFRLAASANDEELIAKAVQLLKTLVRPFGERRESSTSGRNTSTLRSRRLDSSRANASRPGEPGLKW
jgi:hypothetical protein